MSIYDERCKPAYGNFVTPPEDALNPHIIKWWTLFHDDLLRKRIRMYHWVWYWGITDEVLSITPKMVIDGWKREDPQCSARAWYNVLMDFAASRAENLGFTKNIRLPQWKVCASCSQRFVEDSLPVPLVERLGIERLDFCAPCAGRAIFNVGDHGASNSQVITYLKDLAALLQRIPAQDFGDGKNDLIDLTTEERLAAFKILLRKPSVQCVKALYGSWLKALLEAELLENGARPTSRGTQCLAKDGHVCFSLGEKTIDDFLFSRGIQHEREPAYPEGSLRADFIVKGIFIEYFGLMGNDAYETKMFAKQDLCEEHGIRLISIYPEDLTSVKKLEKKLSVILSLA